MMDMIVDTLVGNLRVLIRDLGKDGGMLSPSVYDTAQVLRLCPVEGQVWPAVHWLLSQQHADGGWGDPYRPISRTVPTLASILALRRYCERWTTVEALEAGKAFLRRQLSHWDKPLPDDLPIGMELILAHLFEEAAREEEEDERAGVTTNAKLDISLAPYEHVIVLGERKRDRIRGRQPGPATNPAYSWEAWGAYPDPAMLDATGGVGHSPAATAAWVRMAENHQSTRRELAAEIARARAYLANAAVATSERTPGIYPTAWPINRHEQAFGLYALALGDLLGLPELQEALGAQIADLKAAMRPTGLGLADDFTTDGADTAAAVAVLAATGQPVDLGVLRQFATDQFFLAYAGENQPSLSVTARAIHTLELAGQDASRWWEICADQQQLDGAWPGDRWNTSWLYTTCHVMIALRRSPLRAQLKEAVAALRVNQHPDGGWGMINRSTTVETAYAVLALHNLRASGLLEPDDLRMLRRGYKWLVDHYRPFRMKDYKCWMNKEIYCPQRIDRAYELAALLAVTLGDIRG